MVTLLLWLTAVGMEPEGFTQGGGSAQLSPDDAQSAGTLQGRWKTYRNRRWGFCVSYPPGWVLKEGINGAGASASLVNSGSLPGRPLLSVGALPNQLVNLTSGAPRTLEENFQVDLDGLRESHAEHMKVLRERRTKFRGLPALVTIKRYDDPGNNMTQVEETLWIMKDQVLYSVELKCPLGEVASMEAIYKKMIRTLMLDCRPMNLPEAETPP